MALALPRGVASRFALPHFGLLSLFSRHEFLRDLRMHGLHPMDTCAVQEHLYFMMAGRINTAHFHIDFRSRNAALRVGIVTALLLTLAYWWGSLGPLVVLASVLITAGAMFSGSAQRRDPEIWHVQSWKFHRIRSTADVEHFATLWRGTELQAPLHFRDSMERAIQLPDAEVTVLSFCRDPFLMVTRPRMLGASPKLQWLFGVHRVFVDAFATDIPQFDTHHLRSSH